MPQTVAQKLGVAPHTRVVVIGAPEELSLQPLPEGAEETRLLPGDDAAPTNDAAVVLVCLLGLADVAERVPRARAFLPTGEKLWVAYRKGAGARRAATAAGDGGVLHRDTLQQALGALGLQGVSLVALDDQWSAMRVRPAS